jgi:polyhydroxyalkanoate synthesis regulator phasin
MDLEAEVRNFIRDIEGTLNQAEAEIRKVSQDLQQQAGKKTNEMQPQVKRAIAETIRKTITELERIEARLRS